MLSLALLALSVAAAAAAQQAERGDAAAATCAAGGGGSTAKRGTICYEFFDEETVWVDARDRCRKYNASLVSVTSNDVQRWLETAVEQFLPDRVGVWIGLNDRREEGTYMWDDVGNTDREARYFNWHTGEPNDIILGQDCVYMRKTFKWKWVDVECALPLRRYSFVCEFGPRATADDRLIKEENSLPTRIPLVVVSSASISRVTHVTGPKRVSSIERGTDDQTTIGKSYSLKDSPNKATSAVKLLPGSGNLQNTVDEGHYEEWHNLPQSALQDLANSDSNAFNHTLWFAVFASLALVGGALLACFLVYRNPARLARLKAAAAATLGRRYYGGATKTAAPSVKDDAESKSYLLAKAERQSFFGAVRQQTRTNNGGGSGDGGRAVPNIYVTFGEATAALSVRPSCGGSDDGPVYADLVEPLP